MIVQRASNTSHSIAGSDTLKTPSTPNAIKNKEEHRHGVNILCGGKVMGQHVAKGKGSEARASLMCADGHHTSYCPSSTLTASVREGGITGQRSARLALQELQQLGFHCA